MESVTGSTSSTSRILEAGFLLAMVLACAVAFSPNNVDPDLWGHVQYAEDSLAAGTLHTTATHTFTADGYRWINHENLSELALAVTYRALGPHGLLMGKCVLGLLVLWLMLRAAQRQGVSLLLLCLYFPLVATTLTAFWAVRPQVASFVLLACMVALLDRAFASWSERREANSRWLWPLPLLMAVWANAHGGFVAGLGLLVAYLGLRSLEALYYRGHAAWRQVAWFSFFAVASALATLLNPYGVGLHRWLAGALAQPRPEITEWLPPMPQDAFFLPMTILYGLIFVAWIGTSRRRDWTQFALLALCIWQSLLHSRHVPLAAVLAGFWLPVHLQSLLDRCRTATTEASDSRLGRLLIGGGLAAALVLLVAKLDTRLRDLPVERDQYPVAAIQYMAEQNFEGDLVVTFNWAQYALAALEPQVRVAFDGRFRTCYPQEVIDMHFDFLYGDLPGRRYRSPNSGRINGNRVLDYQQPDLVLIDRAYCRPQKILQRREDFVLLYQDATAQLWGRRSRYDDRRSPHYLAASTRRISDAPQPGSVTWPAFPRRDPPAQLAHRAGAAPTPVLAIQEDRS